MYGGTNELYPAMHRTYRFHQQLPMENSDKSLLPSGFGMRPTLIQAHGSRKQTQTIVDVLDRSSHEVMIPEMQSKICLGSVYDGSWLLMLDEDTRECFLLSFTGSGRRRSKISLPPLRLRPASDYRGATCGVLGSPPANFTVVLTSDRESEGEQWFRLCCRPGDEEWTDLMADGNRLVWTPGSSVSHAGKLYSGNLEVMDSIGGGAVVRCQSLDTGGEVEGMYGMTVRHLVVSDRDIFRVIVEYLGRHHDGSLTRILVHRLDLSSLVWTTVESIGSDRVFLLSSDCGLSTSAASAQLQGNCIYLVWSSCDCERLYKFCLDDMTKSFHQILPQPTTPCSRAYWVVSDDE